MGTFPSFKKIIQKYDSFILGTLLVLSLDYLALFFIESILPGYVMNNFNLNYLLVFILAGWLTLLFTLKGKVYSRFSKKHQILLLSCFVALFFLGTWFTLYEMRFWEMSVVLILLGIIGVYLYKK